jgi:hypothetical protein
MAKVEEKSEVIRSFGHTIGWVSYGGCENENCLKHMAKGRMWHAIPRIGTLNQYHYKTRAEAIAVIKAVA